MRRVIAKRKQYKAFSRGDIAFIDANNPKILAFTRTYQDEILLVIINLSRYAQQAELELSSYNGFVPIEVFSQNEFTPISDQPYLFPMQFKNYYWFELKKVEVEETYSPAAGDSILQLRSSDWNRMNENTISELKGFLKDYMHENRWFRGKSRKIRAISVNETIPVDRGDYYAYLFLITTSYIEGKDEYYIMPIALATGDQASELKYRYPESLICDVKTDRQDGVLYDASYDEEVRNNFLRTIISRSKIKGLQGEIAGVPGKKTNTKISKQELPLSSKVLAAEQSNTSVLYDNRFFFKMYRSPEEGKNPELEILKALTENTSFENFPGYTGSMVYHRSDGDNMSLGILVDFIPNEGNAWEFTKNAIERYFDRVIGNKKELARAYENATIMNDENKMKDLIGPFFLQMIELLGRRTAEMHLALASIKINSDFTEEPFSLLYQKSLYQSFRTLIKRTVNNMKLAKKGLDDEQKELVTSIIEKEGILLSTIKQTLEEKKIHTSKIRVHGDYHLGQVLFTGKDFIIIDFEGEPTRSLTARSLKYCPLKDVAGMLRSFHYAIYMGQIDAHSKIPGSSDFLNPWLEFWYRKVRDTFVNSYLKTAGNASFIPEEKRQLDDLLSVFTIEKAVYEADYELNNRPDWLHIPLNGLNEILSEMSGN